LRYQILQFGLGFECWYEVVQIKIVFARLELVYSCLGCFPLLVGMELVVCDGICGFSKEVENLGHFASILLILLWRDSC
jgi:hypothetical protein